MYILREIVEKTIFPKKNQQKGSRYLYVGPVGNCSVRLLGPIYSCYRIYLHPNANIKQYFNSEELKILLSGKEKALEYGNRNIKFKETVKRIGFSQTENINLKQFLTEIFSEVSKIRGSDAYLINCLTRSGSFMGISPENYTNIRIMSISKGGLNNIRETYGEDLNSMSGIYARDLIMYRRHGEIPAEQVSAMPTAQVYPVPIASNDIVSSLNGLTRNQETMMSERASFPVRFSAEYTAEYGSPQQQPLPVRYLPNNDLSYLEENEIKYITENGLLDIKETIEFENNRTLYKGSGYYITKFEEIGDEIPIIKFKGKLQKQLVEMEEEQEILNVEDKINQIPNELLGNEKDYSNSIMSLEL